MLCGFVNPQVTMYAADSELVGHMVSGPAPVPENDVDQPWREAFAQGLAATLQLDWPKPANPR